VANFGAQKFLTKPTRQTYRKFSGEALLTALAKPILVAAICLSVGLD
jgi:hypothetical protein